MNTVFFTPFELVLLAVMIGIGLYLLADNLYFKPLRQLRGQGSANVTRDRAILAVFFIMLGRLIFLLVKRAALDFSLVLVLLGAVSGLIWALDAWVLRPLRLKLAAESRKPEAAAEVRPVAAEYAQSFFPIIVIVLIIRSFLLEPFRIPSDSMMPTLFDGDFIFVNKYAYGLRLPVTNTKVVSVGDPKRGDVVVFRLPSNPSVNYIKRLVGLPGDHVVVRKNHVFVNGTPMPVEVNGFYSDNHGYSNAQLATETLGDVKHTVMFTTNQYHTDFDQVVPAGHFFFMGDNRNNSQDSRFPVVGFVPEGNLVGRAVRIWMNWRVPEWPKWSRIGTKIE